jgi:methyl-accepting chemotaxis protein
MTDNVSQVKFSLRIKFILFVLWSIFILSVLYSGLYLIRSKIIMESELSKRGGLLVQTISNNARFGVLAEDKQFLSQIITGTLEDKDVSYVIISNPEGKLLATRFRNTEDENELQKVFSLRNLDEAVKISLPVGGTVINLNRKIFIGNEGFQTEAEQQGGGAKQDIKGYVQLGISTAALSKDFRRLVGVGALFFLINLFVGSVITYVFANRFLSPISLITNKTLDIAKGDLTQKLTLKRESKDEVGILADTFNKMSINLNEMVKSIHNSSENVMRASNIVATSAREVLDGSHSQDAIIEETSKSIDEINTAIKGIADNLEILSNSAEESSSSILELGASIEEVAENMETLSSSVEETTSSVTEMAASIKQVASHINELFKISDNTASAVNQMDAAVKHVEKNTLDTARLSEEAMKDAEEGVASVEKTIEGINKIYEISVESAKVISSLGDKAQEIGNILNVIDDVAEETNLLALNAAIIAAQAGEHGRGFAVVADEIKDLAERTAASTKEIAQLIRTVQEESQRSVKTVNLGMKTVEEGVLLAQRAGETLKKIYQSSQTTKMMSNEIAKATSEQVKGNRMITDSIEKMVTMIEEISKATGEQAQGSEQIMRAAQKMRDITIQVKNAVQEQAKGSKHITNATENIRDMVNYINTATQTQQKSTEQVVKSIENIKQISRRTIDSVSKLDRAVASLTGAAESLQMIVSRFKV